MEYLDFELPIKELEDQLDKCQLIGQESNVDVTNTCKQIEKKLEDHKAQLAAGKHALALNERERRRLEGEVALAAFFGFHSRISARCIDK